MFGNAWSVKVWKYRRAKWQGGMIYNYGLMEANYPVPAIPIECNVGISSIFFWWNSNEYVGYPKACKVIWKDWHHA